jgi:flavodoxin
MKAAIIYQSKTGITKKYAESIGNFLTNKGIINSIVSIKDYRPEIIDEVDLVMIGCWTSGLMIFFQHPDNKWIRFAKKLPPLNNKKVGLFTTYKLATGSMFRKMRQYLKIENPGIELRSKNGMLSKQDQERIIALTENM